MKATYDGTLLALGGFTADSTWLVSFQPGLLAAPQIARPMRASHVVLHARGLRQRTISLVFRPPPCADVDESFNELALFFSTQPDQGDLVLESGARAVTYPDACLQGISPRPRMGISNEFPVTFLAGAATGTTLSALAQMDSRYPNLLDLAGLTGGGSTKLDGQITADVAVKRVVKFYLVESSVLIPHEWVLRTWTDEVEDAGAGIVIPDDFHATTNPKFWHRTL